MAPSGRLRLDSIARWVQDVAWADVEVCNVYVLSNEFAAVLHGREGSRILIEEVYLF